MSRRVWWWRFRVGEALLLVLHSAYASPTTDAGTKIGPPRGRLWCGRTCCTEGKCECYLRLWPEGIEWF